MPSLDIVSEIDMQEAENGINQAKKEIQSRYDFRGSKSEIDWDKKTITITGDDEYKMGAMKDILQSKMHKRGIDIAALKFSDVEAVGGMMLKQKVEFAQGIEKDIAKKINKGIKDAKLKVQSQVQGDLIRVTSKSINELQATMRYCKGEDFGIPLQFTNMRS